MNINYKCKIQDDLTQTRIPLWMWYEHENNVCNKIINYHLLGGFKNFSTGSIKMRAARFVGDVKLLLVTRAWCTIRLRTGLEETWLTPESERRVGGRRESVISFSGDGERDASPTVVPKYEEINKLLKLKSSVSLLSPLLPYLPRPFKCRNKGPS